MSRIFCGFLMASLAWCNPRELVVIDTDTGLFGDDGAAIVMLLRSPQHVTVSGITLVPGNVWPAQSAEYVFHILDLAKHPAVPVYTGAETPLMHTAAMAVEAGRRWGKLEFIGAFADPPDKVVPARGPRLSLRKPHRHEAIEFLVSEIERHPGELTILAIGPMTNIALALRLKPQIESKIKQIVFMGGNVHVAGNASAAAEFNFWFDPEAARIVLRSRIPHKIMFALDVCNTAPLRKAEFDQIASARTPIAGLFREDFGHRYPGFLQHPGATAYLWDALAAAWLLDPGFVTRSETRYLDVLTAWGRFYGATVPLDRHLVADATPVMLATELDFRRVFALYKELLTSPE